MKSCKWCSIKYENGFADYCSVECMNAARLEKFMKNNNVQKEEPKNVEIKRPSKPKRRLTKSEKNSIARSMGLSYGQYVAMMIGGAKYERNYGWQGR